jgi:predicted dehydrogenase
VGFVGSGGMAEAHRKPLEKLPEVEIVAFCDLNLALAEKLAAEYQAQAFDNAAAMFESVELDAVYMCLPPFGHGPELLAVEHGVPFFVEKPIHLDLGQAREIAAAVEEKGLLTCAGYMNRYRAGIQKVKDLLAGDPAILVLGGWIGGTPRPREGQGIWSWWVDKAKSGGQFHEQVTHTVDLVRFLGGEAVEVHAYAARGFNTGTPDNYTNDDAAVVNIHLASGGVANLWASCSTNGGGGGVTLNVYANNVTALFTGWEHSLRLFQTGKEPEEIKGEGDIFLVEDQAFINAVRTKDARGIRSSYTDALKTLEITLAANESMATGRPVAIG